MVQPIWKRTWKFLTKLNIVLPYGPAIMLLEIYLIGMKSMSTQKSAHKYLQQFTYNCHNWKQPRCIEIGE